MENEKKINLFMVFFIIALIVIVVMGYFMYNLYNEKQSEIEKLVKSDNQVSNSESFNNLTMGRYSKHIVVEDYDEYDISFTFKDDNTFSAYFGEAGALYGAYKIYDDKTINCTALYVYSEQLIPNYVPARGNTIFKILDSSTIEVVEAKDIIYGIEENELAKTFYEKGDRYILSR